MVFLSALLLAAKARLVDPTFGEWSEVSRADPADSTTFVVVLKREKERLEMLETLFWEVSDPRHENYGKHLTQEEVTALIDIKEDHVNAVEEFFTKNGATVDVGAHRDLLEVILSVEKTEQLFDTHLFNFLHKSGENSIIRAKKTVSIPTELERLIEVIDNLEGFPAIRRPIIVQQEDLDSSVTTFPDDYNCGGKCPNLVTPGVLTERYSLGDAVTSGAQGSMAVAEFQGVYWSQEQLDTFNQACGVNSTIDTQIGDNNPSRCNGVSGTLCTEALLDIEYIRAVAGQVRTVDVFNADYSLLSWAKQLEDLSDGAIPLINSVSYGNDEVQQQSAAYMDSCNVEFQKLGVRGISILFASGDQGVWGRSGIGFSYHPDFPASSPYITAVGGTDFAKAGEIGDEKAWNDGGGGFSNHFAIPDYQADAVATYKKTAGLPPQSRWNNTGRGYPDVSALGGIQNGYCVRTGGRFVGVGGTSASCPVFAGVVAKLNELRLKKGGKPLGFLNPFLYQNADAFNDVTLGRNGGALSRAGFPAATGWDACTGLGTPNFEALSQKI